ncbi:hypothetical protein L7F22_040260 [Adiantum nelumboides]|nr:hypothetical protein [Adiantum nelumboides]
MISFSLDNLQEALTPLVGTLTGIRRIASSSLLSGAGGRRCCSPSHMQVPCLRGEVDAYLCGLADYHGKDERCYAKEAHSSAMYASGVQGQRENSTLTGAMFTLHPLTLSGEQVKLAEILLSTGEEGYLLDHENYQFYKVRVANLVAGSFETPISIDLDPDELFKPITSAIDMIRALPRTSRLFHSLAQIKDVFKVKQLPKHYDGYVAYEFPAAGDSSGMAGMEQRHDSHLWTEYVTCSSNSFMGAVRFSRCSGHLRCVNLDCPYHTGFMLCNEIQWKDAIGDEEFAAFLDSITPLSNKRRFERTLELAKKAKNISVKGLEVVLDLKSKSKYPYIQSALLLGQLGKYQQPHVFKMSVKGPGSGVDIVNRMRPSGNLENMWIHFDHVHHVNGWPTMSPHVYDPFVRELMTIATAPMPGPSLENPVPIVLNKKL